MNDEAREAIAKARRIGEARAAGSPKIDYAGVNRVFPKQKAALTRAVNSGDPDKVVLACKKVVQEWGDPPFDGAWPDDWGRWQRALDDALGFGREIELGDLR